MKKFVKLGFAVMLAMAFVFMGCKHSTSEPEPVPEEQPEQPNTGSSYTVSIATGITNGTVTADKTSAQKDETVTLTLAPDDGYEFGTVSVKDADNNDIATTSITEGTTYTFVMPDSNVTVVAMFVNEILEMVDVARSTVTITGADPSFVSSGAKDYYKGVFINGRKVTLSPYKMSKYEVTQDLYKMIMQGEMVGDSALDAEPSRCKETGTYLIVEGEVQGKRPVEWVTWYDAVYFCNVLTEKTLGSGLSKKKRRISSIFEFTSEFKYDKI